MRPFWLIQNVVFAKEGTLCLLTLLLFWVSCLVSREQSSIVLYVLKMLCNSLSEIVKFVGFGESPIWYLWLKWLKVVRDFICLACIMSYDRELDSVRAWACCQHIGGLSDTVNSCLDPLSWLIITFTNTYSAFLYSFNSLLMPKNKGTLINISECSNKNLLMNFMLNNILIHTLFNNWEFNWCIFMVELLGLRILKHV